MHSWAKNTDPPVPKRRHLIRINSYLDIKQNSEPFVTERNENMSEMTSSCTILFSSGTVNTWDFSFTNRLIRKLCLNGEINY